MRILALLILLPAVALAHGPRITDGLGTIQSGPRILGESTFAFELDALEQDEASRSAWPVTTTRPSSRWCETWSGWQSVGNGVPCIGIRGMAAFGPGMNYIANSSLPTLVLLDGATVATVTEGGLTFQRITLPAGGRIQITPAAGPVVGDTLTATVIVRGTGSPTFSPEIDTAFGRVMSLGPAWSRESHTTTATTTPRLVIRALAGAAVVDLAHAQLERSAIPGPRHDCAGAACSWSGDVHRISTTGMPVASSEIRLRYTPLNAGAPDSTRILWDSRTAGLTGGLLIDIATNGTLRVEFRGASGSLGVIAIPTLAWAASDTPITVRWSGTSVTLTRNPGESVSGSLSGIMGAHAATATIGASNISGGVPAQGHIRLVRVSN